MGIEDALLSKTKLKLRNQYFESMAKPIQHCKVKTI